jgi:hypothetical protein
MRALFLLSFLGGLILGVISMLVGIDRHEQRRRMTPLALVPTAGAFAALVGATGYLLNRYTALPDWTVLAIAVSTGIVAAGGMLGIIAGWALPSAAREVVDERFVLQGHFGTVTAPIMAGGLGEITFETHGARHKTAARSLDGHAMDQGTEIVIERVEDGVAYVERWSRIEKELELP